MARMKITEETRLLEVLQSFPQTRKVFERYGMGCRSCMGAAAETIGRSAMTHGVDPKTFVRELNEAVRAG
jgi:hybrid cluster-associated redox disulfide protein